jgi:hypothetical protein
MGKYFWAPEQINKVSVRVALNVLLRGLKSRIRFLVIKPSIKQAISQYNIL